MTPTHTKKLTKPYHPLLVFYNMASVSADGSVTSVDIPWCPTQCAVGTGVTFASRKEDVTMTVFLQSRPATAAPELIVPPSHVPMCPPACISYASSAAPVTASAAPMQGGFVVQFLGTDPTASGTSTSSQ